MIIILCLMINTAVSPGKVFRSLAISIISISTKSVGQLVWVTFSHAH